MKGKLRDDSNALLVAGGGDLVHELLSDALELKTDQNTPSVQR